MAQIGLNIDISGYTDDLLIVWKKASAPLAEVGRSAALPFPVSQVYTIPNLQPEVYSIEFWRSADGTALTEFIKSWSIDASQFAEYGLTVYQYVVGRGDSGSSPDWADPENGDGAVGTPLVDERLAGVTHTNAFIESRGHGKYRQDEITFVPTGGFYFADGVTRFNEGDTFFVTVQNASSVSSGSGSAAVDDFTDIVEIRDDVDNSIDFDSSLYRKVCHTGFTGAVGTVVFPSFALIPDTKVRFLCHRGSQNYLKLQFSTGETVVLDGESKNVIYLERGAMIELWFKNNVCYVADYKGNNQLRGRVAPDYSLRSGMGMFIRADGSLISGNNYPGIYEFVTEKLPVGASVDLTTWSASTNNQKKWGVNTTTKEIRVPNLAGVSQKFSNSDVSGTYEADQVGPFTLSIPTSALTKNDEGSSLDNKLATGGATPPPAAAISFPVSPSSENRVKGVIQYPMIYL